MTFRSALRAGALPKNLGISHSYAFTRYRHQRQRMVK